MRLKNFLMVMTTLLLTACSGCGPHDKENTDSVEQDPYPFVTWDECSQVVGEHPCNFTLKDQNDEEVSLYDFYGSVIILDLSAMWCGPCQVAGSDVQATVERFAEHDVRYLTVLVDDPQGQPPSLAYVQSWALNLGIVTEPVLQGSREFLNADPTKGWPLSSWPTFVLITADMKITVFQAGYSQQLLDMLIEDAIAQAE